MAIVGFLCFIMGMMSLFLSTIGIHFVFLRFLENWGPLPAFLIKLAIVVAGFVLIYLSRTQYPRKSN